MKTKLTQILTILSIVFTLLLIAACQKKENNEDLIPDPVLQNSYDGTLVAKSTNVIPPWSETSLGMNVHIDKEFGLVTIENGTLEYNGDTVINNDSRIERGGFWNMYPTGILKTDGGINYLEVDANIEVMLDVQKIYAKDDHGNWILVNTIEFTGEPNSDLVFVLADAISESSVVGFNDQNGSITWTLALIEAP